MGRLGGGFWGQSKIAAAGAAVLALAACASTPSTIYDLAAARPSSAHGLRAQIRIGQPTATADLDSDHILVRDSQTLATLAGASWPEPLPALFRARLAQSFVNAGLGTRDRRPRRERGLRGRSRYPRLRVRRRDERSACRHRRLDRRARQRTDRGRPDFHASRAGRFNRGRRRRGGAGSGGFDRHDRNRQIRRQGVVRVPPSRRRTASLKLAMMAPPCAGLGTSRKSRISTASRGRRARIRFQRGNLQGTAAV